MHSPFLKIGGNVADQEAANVAMMTMLYAPRLLAGCCVCSPLIRLGRNSDHNICPDCGKAMEMHRIPSLIEDFDRLFEAGYLTM
ncbi:MAG: hypothetical protein GY832_11300 [Chloroflexi bacterium]|nr:hypothetical protein [Chloroflexota bacterium]